MLKKIKLSNFKCFHSLDLNCAPLTLLCGLNGMGKSSVIQALLLLRQSFESGDLLEGRLVLGGELADLGTGTDVLYEGADSDIVGFELQSDEINAPWGLSFGYSQTTDQLIVETSDSSSSFPSCLRIGRKSVHLDTIFYTLTRSESVRRNPILCPKLWRVDPISVWGVNTH